MSQDLAFELLLKVENAKKALEGLDRTGKDVGANAGDSFGNSFAQRAKSRLDKASSKITSAVTNSLKVAGVAAAGFATLSTKTFVDFQTELNNVKALTGATAEEFEKLKKQARLLGRESVFSASEAAAGQGFLAQAGFDTQEILAAMPTVLDLAAAGNLELARAADIASNIMGQFNIEAENANRITNLLAATASSSNTNIEQLSEAMKYLGPNAESLGISLEETAAIVGVLGDAGIQGSLAGRALGSSLVRLTNPTAKMQTTMSELGLSFFDVNGDMKSMGDIIEMLNTRTKDLSKEQRSAAISTIFGAEAYQEISILMQRGAEGFDSFTKSITGTNKASEIAETKLEGLPGVVKRLRSVFEDLQIRLLEVTVEGKTLADWLVIGGEKLAEFILSIDWQKLFDDVKNFAEKSGLIKLITILGDFLAKNPELVVKIAMIAGGLVLLIPVLSFAVNLFITLSGVVGFLIKAWPIFATLLSALTSPVGLVVAAIALVVAGLILAYNKSEAFRDFVNNTFLFLKDVIISTWTAITDFLGLSWEDKMFLIGQKTGEMIAYVINFFATLPEKAEELFFQTMEKWGEAIATGKEKAKGFINDIIKWFSEIDLYQIGVDMINGLMNGIRSQGEALRGTIGNLTSGVSEGFGNVRGRLGFAQGGFTGEGPRNAIKGVVHSNEGVFNPRQMFNLLKGIEKIGTQNNNNTNNYYGVNFGNSFTNANLL